jgi:DNA modification methylase
MTYYSFGDTDLIVGDCRDVMKNMVSESFRLIIADPPYRLKSWEGFGRKSNWTYDTPPPQYDEWIPECLRLLKPDGSLFVFENPVNEYDLMGAVERAGFIRQPNLVWFVTFRASHPRKGWYNSHYEPVIWGTKTTKWYFDSKPLAGKGSDLGGDVYAHPAQSINAIVPGQKPKGLIQRLVECHTQPGDNILDPFAGSCITLRVAKNLGRRATGIEMNPEVARKAIDYRDLKSPGAQNFLELGDGKVDSENKVH